MVRTGLYVAATALLLLPGCGDGQPDVAQLQSSRPEDYAPMCRTGLAAAKEFSRRLRTSTVVDEPPVIVSAGPPVRLRCSIRSRQGVPGEVTTDVKCLRQFDRTCVRPVTATLGGIVVQGPGRVGPDRWP